VRRHKRRSKKGWQSFEIDCRRAVHYGRGTGCRGCSIGCGNGIDQVGSIGQGHGAVRDDYGSGIDRVCSNGHRDRTVQDGCSKKQTECLLRN
jgi:hypothetical protein